MAVEVINSVSFLNKGRGVHQAVYNGVPIGIGRYQHYDLGAIREQLSKYTLFCGHEYINPRNAAPYNYHGLPYARAIFEDQIRGINSNILLKDRGFGKIYDPESGTVSSIVTAQIGVKQEEPESLVPMVASLNEAAEELRGDGKVLFFP